MSSGMSQPNSGLKSTSGSTSEHGAASAATKTSSRVWWGVALVAAFWLFRVIVSQIDMPIFNGFLTNVAGRLLFMLLFLVWWLTNRDVRRSDRWLALLVTIITSAIVARLSDRSVGVFGLLFSGIPLLLTAWVGWEVIGRRPSETVHRYGLFVVIVLMLASNLLVRVDGIDGQQRSAISFRWSETPEERFLAERKPIRTPDSMDKPPVQLPPVTLTPGDWPAYRGPQRDGVITGTSIASDWSARSPKLVWRQRVGPAWSSILIVDGRLFTQEQRGELEATICLDAATGKEIWAHEDSVRFWDGQGGAGPRATPAFDSGRIYAQGATGLLNCLDAATGRPIWTHDLVKEVEAPTPIWGFSSSPLVVDGLVIVYSGASEKRALLAYRADSGELAWSAPAGPMSYSSPQLMKFDGQSQVVFLSDEGLTAFDTHTGQQLWQYEAKAPNWRATQPRQVGATGLIFGTEDQGLVRLEIKHSGDNWSAEQRWISKAMKPAYNDFVELDGSIYGFDGGIVGCVDAETGKRRWRGGRYGHGQMILLADQQLLLVISETGEVVLLRAQPEKLEELGRLPAITGKTWNHPTIVQGKLYVRNDEEMACYALPTIDGK